MALQIIHTLKGTTYLPRCATTCTAQRISIRVTPRDLQVIRLYASRFDFCPDESGQFN
jgi:hypothetical protein